MSESMWGYLFLILGIVAAALLMLFGNISVKDEHDYYLLKEATQNAMLDSVDDVAYQIGLTQDEVDRINTIDCDSGQPGTIRIVTEKFVENFARRFSEVAAQNTDYTVEIYKVQECPAKVSLKVKAKQNYSWVRKLFRGRKTGDDNKIITTKLTSILETKD